MPRGNFSTDGDFEARLDAREALLVPTTPFGSEDNNGPGRLPLPSKPRYRPPSTALPAVKDPNTRVSKRGTRQRGAVSIQGRTRIPVCNPLDLQQRRALLARYEDNVGPTLISEDVTGEMGLRILPQKPGRQEDFFYKGKWYTSNEFTTVCIDVCGLPLLCSLAILPKGFAEFEGIELLVGSKLRAKLDLAPKNIRNFLDNTLPKRPSKSTRSSKSAMGPRPGSALQTAPEPARHPPQASLRPANIGTSFGASHTMSGRASYHSSNDIGLVSTPLTSLCESGSAMHVHGPKEEKSGMIRNDCEDATFAYAAFPSSQFGNIEGYRASTVNSTSRAPGQPHAPLTLQVPSRPHPRRQTVPASDAQPMFSPVFDNISAVSHPSSHTGVGNGWRSTDYEHSLNDQTHNMPQTTSTFQQCTSPTPEFQLSVQGSGLASLQGAPFTARYHLPDQGSNSEDLSFIDPKILHFDY